MDTGELAGRIADVRSGGGDPAALVGEFRRAVVLVPVTDGGLMTAERGGVRWVYAFTDEEALARFALARGDADPAGEWEYRAVLGARLLDKVVPSLGEPAGVVVNVADGEGAMVFPPVRGIVPDVAAVRMSEEDPT